MTPQTYILRHRRENLKKCSLSGLESHPLLHFLTYPTSALPPLPFLLLKVGAPPLTPEDSSFPLLFLDATWRLAAVMEKAIPSFEARSLPPARTAYPRRQTECPDPETGLSTIEAIYLAHHTLGKPTEGLLENYRWRETFFNLNAHLLV